MISVNHCIPMLNDFRKGVNLDSTSIYCPIVSHCVQIRVITKLPNSEQSYKGKVKTHNYTNRQNQSTTGKL